MFVKALKSHMYFPHCVLLLLLFILKHLMWAFSGRMNGDAIRGSKLRKARELLGRGRDRRRRHHTARNVCFCSNFPEEILKACWRYGHHEARHSASWPEGVLGSARLIEERTGMKLAKKSMNNYTKENKSWNEILKSHGDGGTMDLNHKKLTVSTFLSLTRKFIAPSMIIKFSSSLIWEWNGGWPPGSGNLYNELKNKIKSNV